MRRVNIGYFDAMELLEGRQSGVCLVQLNQ